MANPLLALTVHQPYAWALSVGSKPVENRGWAPPDNLIGRPLAIHAGRQYDEEAAGEMCSDRAISALALPGPPPRPAAIATGAIVAVARLAGWVLAEPPDEDDLRLVVKGFRGVTEARARELAASPWACGPYLWVVEDVVRIEPPVPCRGFQKLWAVPPAITDVVRERFVEARRGSAA